MNRFRLGARLESLNLPLRPALVEAAKTGVTGVQFDAVGDLSPKQLGPSARRELNNLLGRHNVELTALGCPLRRGLDTPEDQQPRLERVMEAMSLSYDLGARRVILSAGPVPADDKDPRAGVLAESLKALAVHGDRIGVVVALETGLESGEALAAYLATFDTGSLGVNLDPANLLMHGFDPYAGAVALHRFLVHTHAKDARRATANRVAQEVPLGAGDIDWLRWVETLNEIDYRGWLVVERESGENRLADVAAGVRFLRRIIG